MNNNNYYIKSFTDTEFRNLESFFTLCNVSVSSIKGLGEFGEPKNILVEEYSDQREIDIILPPSGEEIIYKPTDVTINILVQGNSNYKVQDQVSIILDYVKGGIYFKDMARGLGNKLLLVGNSESQAKVTIGKSTSEYKLLTLKFKKLFDIDLQIVSSLTNVLEDSDPDMLTFQSTYLPATYTKGFTECGYYFKQIGGNYTKYTVTRIVGEFSKVFTSLTPNTTYLCKPFFTTEFETVYGAELTRTTPAS